MSVSSGSISLGVDNNGTITASASNIQNRSNSVTTGLMKMIVGVDADYNVRSDAIDINFAYGGALGYIVGLGIGFGPVSVSFSNEIQKWTGDKSFSVKVVE